MTIALILKSYLNNEKTIVNQRYIGTKSPKVLRRHREGSISGPQSATLQPTMFSQIY